MIRRNRLGREIWFDRVLWSYLPCHWKGWLFLIGVILGLLAIELVVAWVLHGRDQYDIEGIVGLLGIVWMLVITERHSP